MKDFEKYTKEMNNYQLMVYATELFKQFLYFLRQERGYKTAKFKIGSFNYDGWNAEIYCILNRGETNFKHTRDYDNLEWKNKTLIEYAFAWGFEEIDFKFNFNLINNFYNILNESDKKTFDELYDEVHCDLW